MSWKKRHLYVVILLLFAREADNLCLTISIVLRFLTHNLCINVVNLEFV